MSRDSARLFIGTFVPSEQKEILLKLRDSNPHLDMAWGLKLRWVKPEKMHMTWCFLGEVQRSRIDEAKAALSSAVAEYKIRSAQEAPDSPNTINCTESLWLRFDKTAFWPNQKKARVLVLEASKAPAQLLTLHDCITRELEPFLENTEKELESKFRTHITVIRLASGANRQPLSHKKPLSLDAIANLESVGEFSFPITEVALIESHLDSQSEAYEPLAVLSLS